MTRRRSPFNRRARLGTPRRSRPPREHACTGSRFVLHCAPLRSRSRARAAADVNRPRRSRTKKCGPRTSPSTVGCASSNQPEADDVRQEPVEGADTRWRRRRPSAGGVGRLPTAAEHAQGAPVLRPTIADRGGAPLARPLVGERKSSKNHRPYFATPPFRRTRGRARCAVGVRPHAGDADGAASAASAANAALGRAASLPAPARGTRRVRALVAAGTCSSPAPRPLARRQLRCAAAPPSGGCRVRH